MNIKTKHTFLFLILFLSITIFSGCSSDSDSSSPTLTGTIATGAAGVGTLYITDSKGSVINVVLVTADNGQYSANIAGMTAPFILGFDQAPADGVNDLYSYAEEANTKANVSQLTTLTLFLANDETDLAALYTGWDTTQLTATKISAAQVKVNANLATQIDAISGLDSTNYDFMTTSFTPDGTGIDGLLDDVTVDISDPNNFTVTVAGEGGFTFNVSIDVSSITVGDTIIETGDFDATCSSGWCLTQSGTYSVAGTTTSIPETKISGLPESDVPTAGDFTDAQQSFESAFSSFGEISNASYGITTNTSTKVVVEISATITPTEFGAIPFTYTVIFTYTKAAP